MKLPFLIIAVIVESKQIYHRLCFFCGRNSFLVLLILYFSLIYFICSKLLYQLLNSIDLIYLICVSSEIWYMVLFCYRLILITVDSLVVSNV